MVEELAREGVDLILGHREDEVVAAVLSQREGAVVFAEEGCVAHTLGFLGDVDVAVAHGLDLAVGDEGFHFREVGAAEVEDVQVVVYEAEGHHAVEGCGSLNLVFFVVTFHCF